MEQVTDIIWSGEHAGGDIWSTIWGPSEDLCYSRWKLYMDETLEEAYKRSRKVNRSHFPAYAG